MLPTVSGKGYCTSTNGLVTATIYETGRRSDSEDKTMAGDVRLADISGVGRWRKSNPFAVTMCGFGRVFVGRFCGFESTLLYDSDNSCTPVGSIVFSSDEGLPLSPGQDDRRKVRKRNSRLSSRSELLDRPANEPAKIEKSVDMNNDSMMYKPPVDELPEWSDSELMPLITLKKSPVVDKMKMTGCPWPNGSEVLLPRSPETVGFNDQDVSSAPLSPNRVKEGHSQDMPAEGSIFDVSPDLPGYRVQQSDTAQTPPSTYGSFNDPFFGAPIAFPQCHKMPGLDTPMTLPIYNLPKEANLLPDQ